MSLPPRSGRSDQSEAAGRDPAAAPEADSGFRGADTVRPYAVDLTARRLPKVQIDDAIEADRVFTMLIGDDV